MVCIAINHCPVRDAIAAGHFLARRALLLFGTLVHAALRN
jgi:hypothetical protein